MPLKSFKQFITETPELFDLGSGWYVSGGAPEQARGRFIGKPVSKFAVLDGDGVAKIVKPKKIGEYTHEESGEKYTFHTAKINIGSQSIPHLSGKKKSEHHIFIGDSAGKIVGVAIGNTIGSSGGTGKEKQDHIGIGISVLTSEHRGRGVYTAALRTFVEKTGHVIYSDTAQTPGAATVWNKLAQGAEDLGHEFRVHPYMSGVDSPTEGIRWHKPLDKQFWSGVRVPPKTTNGEETTIPASNIRFSYRRNRDSTI